VLTVTSTHQNVQFPHHLLNLLKSTISLSDLSKLSTVPTVVKLVLKLLTDVKFVLLTDKTHHIVDVFQDTINLAVTDVLLVLLNTSVSIVLISVSTQKFVNVHKVSMIKEKLNVNNVHSHVLLAKIAPTVTSSNVNLVLTTES
jgi:hypothetical protein